MYPRKLLAVVKRKMGKGKAIIIIGPRQVGKTTLIENLLANKKHLFLNADDPVVRKLLTNPTTEQLKTLIGSETIVFLDEAQRVENIGITLKIITDQFKHVQLLVSGSSAFDLGNMLNEPLTGRKWQYDLLPISWQEIEAFEGMLKAQQQLETRMLYGFYPDVLNHKGEEVEVLMQLVNSYLYKDILALANLRKPELLEKIVQALALQIGNEVSYNELAQLVQVDKNTIATYIDVLEKGYIIYKLPSFSRNLRNELKASRKIYFYDVGVRNAVIGNFSPLDLRQDKGALWENFLISERLKANLYNQKLTKLYFWRTTQQQEIDLIEEEGGNLSAFEFKWNPKAKIKVPLTFTRNYTAEVHKVDMDNFREFLV